MEWMWKNCQYVGCEEQATHEALGYQGIDSNEHIYEMCESHARSVDENCKELKI